MGESGSYRNPRGPFRADQVREDDGCELSQGEAIHCAPTGGQGSHAAATGSAVLKSDPAVTSSGVDTGYALSADTLRAPDIAVGNVPIKPGWVEGVPPLAVEYADTGQDERELQRKIRDLLQAGTCHVWVVRLVGPRRVEVHEPGHPVRIKGPGEELSAPGILKNSVPVEALYDWEVGQDVTLRNLLQRHGYENLEAVLDEGVKAGLQSAIYAVLAARGINPTAALRHAVESCVSSDQLDTWLKRAATASDAASVNHESDDGA